MSVLMEEIYPGCFRAEVAPGISVLAESIPGVRSVALGIWVGAGSREDPKGKEGLAHLTEHMVFKGTERRTATQISQEIDSLGGNLNGATSAEYTVYHSSVLADGIGVALDVLADLVTAPRFAAEDLELERAVALEEIREAEDSPEDVALRLLDEALWGRDHPLGKPILGWRETVSGLTRDDLRAFFQDHYRKGRVAVVGCGALEPRSFVERVRDLLDDARPESEPPRREVPVFRGRRLTVERPIQQVHIALGFPTVPAGSRERAGVEVLNTILGGSLSSRLFQRVREERGLAYSIFSFTRYYTDAGYLGIYAAAQGDKAREILGIIAAELRDLARKLPSPEELERAKRRVRGVFLLGLESPGGRMTRLGWLASLGLPIRSPDEVLGELEAVDGGMIRDLARRYLDPGRAAMALVGPKGESLERLSRWN